MLRRDASEGQDDDRRKNGFDVVAAAILFLCRRGNDGICSRRHEFYHMGQP